MRPFSKPVIDIPAQLALLKQRGLIIQDEAKAHCFLEAVSFFRLTPYMRPFQIPNDASHTFRPGKRLRELTRLYDFDRRLRLLIIDAIERIEVATRAIISNHMAPLHGAHWYLQRQLFQSNYRHEELLNHIRSKQEKACRDHQRDCLRIDGTTASMERKERLKGLRAKESYARLGGYGRTDLGRPFTFVQRPGEGCRQKINCPPPEPSWPAAAILASYPDHRAQHLRTPCAPLEPRVGYTTGVTEDSHLPLAQASAAAWESFTRLHCALHAQPSNAPS